MRIVSRVSILLLILVSQLTSSQERPTHDLNTLLRDASYIVNRFEEVTTGLDGQVDTWKIPVSVKKSIKDGFAADLQNVEAVKPGLNSILNKHDVPSADLFDVYLTLETITSELDAQSTNFTNWGNEQTGIDMAQLGAKARILQAKIGVMLKWQIADQEQQLAACPTKRASHK